MKSKKINKRKYVRKNTIKKLNKKTKRGKYSKKQIKTKRFRRKGMIRKMNNILRKKKSMWLTGGGARSSKPRVFPIMEPPESAMVAETAEEAAVEAAVEAAREAVRVVKDKRRAAAKAKADATAAAAAWAAARAAADNARANSNSKMAEKMEAQAGRAFRMAQMKARGAKIAGVAVEVAKLNMKNTHRKLKTAQIQLDSVRAAEVSRNAAANEPLTEQEELELAKEFEKLEADKPLSQEDEAELVEGLRTLDEVNPLSKEEEEELENFEQEMIELEAAQR